MDVVEDEAELAVDVDEDALEDVDAAVKDEDEESPEAGTCRDSTTPSPCILANPCAPFIRWAHASSLLPLPPSLFPLSFSLSFSPPAPPAHPIRLAKPVRSSPVRRLPSGGCSRSRTANPTTALGSPKCVFADEERSGDVELRRARAMVNGSLAASALEFAFMFAFVGVGVMEEEVRGLCACAKGEWSPSGAVNEKRRSRVGVGVPGEVEVEFADVDVDVDPDADVEVGVRSSDPLRGDTTRLRCRCRLFRFPKNERMPGRKVFPFPRGASFSSYLSLSLSFSSGAESESRGFDLGVEGGGGKCSFTPESKRKCCSSSKVRWR
ncbi:hypothetical protein FB451DRAFT_1235953 [Mycena latifolia]|nr:hypothetical protein FB451DRAFT_1235953 [Mycena latifolia]